MKNITLKFQTIIIICLILLFGASTGYSEKNYVGGISVPNSQSERNKLLVDVEKKYKAVGTKDLRNYKILGILYLRNAADDFTKDNLNKALKVLENIRKIDPTDYQIMSSYGNALSMSAAFVEDGTDQVIRRSQQGLRYMNKAVKKAPNHIGVRLDRAFSCYFAPRFLMQIHYSIEDFGRVLELVGDDWGPGFKAMIHYFLAGSYEKNRQFDEAKEHYLAVTLIKGTKKSKNRFIKYSKNKLDIL